jgi:peptidoglycan/xylan/chitin deacetylase (PgdA/CDA1 family)
VSATATRGGPVLDGESWGACALTFDDGPDPVWTPRVLACLGDEGARATFFVMAARAAAHPLLVDRMRADGHEIAPHCVRHVRHTEIDAWALRRDTQTGLRLLLRLGVRARHWRAPWGITTSASRTVAADLGLELGFWSEIGSHTLKYAAWGDWFDDVRLVEHGGAAFTIWYTRDGVVVGVLTHECGGDYDRGRLLIARAEHP